MLKRKFHSLKGSLSVFFASRTTFRIAVLVVAAVSVYDIHLTVHFSDSIIELEKNPICLFIIKNFGVHSFVIAKSIGMFLCCAVCLYLSGTKYRASVYGLAFFQIFLFMYLTFFTDKNTKPLSPDETDTNPIIHLLGK